MGLVGSNAKKKRNSVLLMAANEMTTSVGVVLQTSIDRVRDSGCTWSMVNCHGCGSGA